MAWSSLRASSIFFGEVRGLRVSVRVSDIIQKNSMSYCDDGATDIAD